MHIIFFIYFFLPGTVFAFVLPLHAPFLRAAFNKQLNADMCGHESTPDGGEEDQDGREWKPEVCFSAKDVQYGGKVVDLSKNITRGPLEKSPGSHNVWRVPHMVKVRREKKRQGVCWGGGDANEKRLLVYKYIYIYIAERKLGSRVVKSQE